MKMLGTFQSGNFKGIFLSGNFTRRQLPKPVLAVALGPLGCSSRSARSPRRSARPSEACGALT